jgi:hypothetical protein
MFQTSFDGKIAMVSGYKHGDGARVALSVQTETIKGGPSEAFPAAVKLALPNVGHGFNAAYYSMPAAVTIADGLDTGHSRVTVDMDADAETWALLFEHITEPDVHVEVTELKEKQKDPESIPAPEVTVAAMVEGKRKRGCPRKPSQSEKDELST